jgi:menaquinone-9 beta-reductase
VAQRDRRCSGAAPRDLVATTLHDAGELDFYHPEMLEVLLRAAAAAGAAIRRGVTVAGVTAGGSPEVAVTRDGAAVERLRARLVVGADGRTSRVRAWADFAVRRDSDCLMVGGVLLRNLRMADDAVVNRYHAALGQRVLIFPLGGGRFRTYFIHRTAGPARCLTGPR